MCRSTAAPLMAMAGMAGTAIGVAIAVLKEKADRRSLQREIDEEQAASGARLETASDTGQPDETGPGETEPDEKNENNSA